MGDMNKLFGAIEGGGTKFICAVGTSPDDIRRETRISTTTPEETLRGTISFFKDAERDLGKLSSLGIATFGPIDPNPASPAYGFVLPTPKPGWSNANVLGMLKSAFDMTIAFELDVIQVAFHKGNTLQPCLLGFVTRHLDGRTGEINTGESIGKVHSVQI